MCALSPQIVSGVVKHVRHSPVSHIFKNSYFFLDFHVTGKDFRNPGWPLLGIERSGFLSVCSRQHMGDRKKSLFENANEYVVKNNHLPADSVRILTVPAVLGFVFNPVSFFFGYSGGAVIWILAEVHNYNGGRRVYLLLPDQKSESELIAQTEKDFHVSPFFSADGRYEFFFQFKDNRITIQIQYFKESENPLLTTVFRGEGHPLTRAGLLFRILQSPLFVSGIPFWTFYQAWRLWRKNLSFHWPDEKSKRRQI